MSGVSGVPPDSGPKRTSGADGKESDSIASRYKKATADSASGGTYKTVMGMDMTKKEYDQFMANMMKSISSQIKSDQAAMKQTQDQIRQDEETEENS